MSINCDSTDMCPQHIITLDISGVQCGRNRKLQHAGSTGRTQLRSARLPKQDVEARLIPRISPRAINSIPLLEARASSEIENIVTTTDRLLRFAPHFLDVGYQD
ncbi:Fic/DOC family N-terminal domain-containing protein [Ensifer aridi]|uniref:Fic/DOC family N-terminal domain-containing protein n=1 Tax=Ensifer aridi TaxID=1708715 RepID=UPI0009BEDE9D